MQVKDPRLKYRGWFVLIAFATVLFFSGAGFAAQLQLSWADNSTNETGFKIDRKTGTSGAYGQIASVGANIISYNDSTVVAGTTYCYRVYAFNSAGNSPYSPEVCASVAAATPTFTLAVTKAGTGSGAMTSSPAGINCTASCSATFNSGAIVTLTATPASGSVFAGWAGTGCSASTAAVSVTMSANTNCTATFNLEPVATFTLTAIKAGTGGGTMSSSPTGISCASTCAASFNGGSVVTLTAIAASGSVFTGWTGTGCTSTTAAVAVTMSTNRSCTATFDLQQASTFTLSVTKAGTGSGTVTSSPTGINCGVTCTGSYTSGATVGLTATPAPGSAFVNWTGTGCTATTATINVSVTTSRSCQATFNGQTTTTALVAKIGVFRPSTGQWFLDANGNGKFDGCAVDTCVAAYGANGMLPIVADWEGTGHTALGVFDPRTGSWHLDNGNGQWDDCSSTGDICVTTYGNPGSFPIVKELSTEKLVIGTFQPQVTTRVNRKNVTKKGVWNFDLDGDGNVDQCSTDQCVENFGQAGDLPVIGDWNGTGGEEIGIFRPSNGLWYLDRNGNGKWDGTSRDLQLGPFGQTGDSPIVGDWDGKGKVRIGVYRASAGQWFLDLNGNGKWDGCTTDACLGPFGQTGDLPVVGKW